MQHNPGRMTWTGRGPLRSSGIAECFAVADWLTQRERALAIGPFDASSSVGAIATPLIVPAITLIYRSRMAFLRDGRARHRVA